MREKKYKVLVLEDEKEDSIQAMIGERFLASDVSPKRAETIRFLEDKPAFLIWDTACSVADTERFMEEIHICEIPLLIITDSQENPILADLVGAPLTLILIRPFSAEKLAEKMHAFLRQIIKW